jgi:K+-transporting ATPase ATPase A chain
MNPLLHMMLNVVFGGKGVGLMNMILYVILAVFLCGLMIGRTPEYLGKKIEGREMKLTALCIIIHPMLILGFTALAVSVPAGLDGITNPDFHGLTQVLYEYASSAANNGSALRGWPTTLVLEYYTGLAMFFGRIFHRDTAGHSRFADEKERVASRPNVAYRHCRVPLILICGVSLAALTFFRVALRRSRRISALA